MQTRTARCRTGTNSIHIPREEKMFRRVLYGDHRSLSPYKKQSSPSSVGLFRWHRGRRQAAVWLSSAVLGGFSDKGEWASAGSSVAVGALRGLFGFLLQRPRRLPWNAPALERFFSLLRHLQFGHPAANTKTKEKKMSFRFLFSSTVQSMIVVRVPDRIFFPITDHIGFVFSAGRKVKVLDLSDFKNVRFFRHIYRHG